MLNKDLIVEEYKEPDQRFAPVSTGGSTGSTAVAPTDPENFFEFDSKWRYSKCYKYSKYSKLWMVLDVDVDIDMEIGIDIDVDTDVDTDVDIDVDIVVVGE
ncbi:hypothetical protein HZH66_006253 [Vespula vulgaris]|uniref:Uncharacterized protein n=1 Tax=Vespula vulgaris TaxID=7454 RepID=A0A834K6S2_VESVU|nr:hypothetical protein HZH66_006253 [Vespula vulgaris]